MADKKVTQLDSLTQVSGDDLFMVVDTPSGVATNKKITASNLFGDLKVPLSVSGNTMTISANATVTGELRLSPSTPSTSNTLTEGIGTGKVWFDHFYLYVAVSNTAIKRVLLSEF